MKKKEQKIKKKIKCGAKEKYDKKRKWRKTWVRGTVALGWDGEKNEKIRVLFEMGDGDLMENKEGTRLILQ